MSRLPLHPRRRFLLSMLGLGLLPRFVRAAADEAPALMLAMRWDDALDPAAYWVSEKYDGVRAHWNGRTLRFRSGRPIPAPPWFVAALPQRPLDGELWLGRGRFQALSAIVRRETPEDAAWRRLHYLVFDLPGEAGRFDERHVRLQGVVAGAAVPWLRAVPQFRVDSRAALAGALARVVAAGGEGLMLHRADAAWMAGRSAALRKLTPWLDAEARVVAHLPGRGKYREVTGALEVEAADGRRFRLGSGLSDAERRNPPPLGSEVTYRYRELTAGGLPRFPVFVRERTLP